MEEKYSSKNSIFKRFTTLRNELTTNAILTSKQVVEEQINIIFKYKYNYGRIYLLLTHRLISVIKWVWGKVFYEVMNFSSRPLLESNLFYLVFCWQSFG